MGGRDPELDAIQTKALTGWWSRIFDTLLWSALLALMWATAT